MSDGSSKILLPEKIISVFTYLTIGIVGAIWLFFAYWKKKKIRPFLAYHIYQSIFIAVLLTVLVYFFEIVFFFFSKIPFLETFVAIINYFFTIKIISIFGYQSTIIKLMVICLILYLIIGVILGKCFYLPFITKVMNQIMPKR